MWGALSVRLLWLLIGAPDLVLTKLCTGQEQRKLVVELVGISMSIIKMVGARCAAESSVERLIK